MDKNTKINDFAQLYKRAYDDRQQEFTEVSENIRYRKGKNWSADEITAHEEQGRIPYSVPIIATKLNQHFAHQMQMPFDLVALARTDQDELPAEIKNAIFKYIRDTNSLKYLVSEWYQDGNVKRVGIIKRDISFDDDIQGDIILEKVLYNQFYWDRNCKKYDISRYANWVQEVLYMTRDELKQHFPDKSELIDNLPAYDLSNSDNDYKLWYRNDKGTELITVIIHGQRKYRVEKGKEEKDEFGEMQKIENDKTTEYIEYSMFTRDVQEVLNEWQEETNVFRYHLIFGGNDDGELFCLVDLLKDPQKWIDRYTSQIDKVIGKSIKASGEVKWDLVHEQDQARWETLSKLLVEGGAWIRTRGQGNAMQGINAGTSGLQSLFEAHKYMTSIIDDITGGRNFQGLQESSGESGKLFALRKEQGSMMAFVWIYNLIRSLQSLGRGIDEDIKTVYGNSVKKIIQLTDEDIDNEIKQAMIKQGMYKQAQFNKSRGYLTIDETTSKLLGDSKTSIIVEVGDYQPTERDRKMVLWSYLDNMLIQSGQPPIPMEIKLKDMPLSYSQKKKLIEWEQQQQAKAEQQQQMQQAEKVNQALEQSKAGAVKAFDTLHKAEQGQQQLVKATVSGG